MRYDSIKNAWKDNCTNETGYKIIRSTNNSTFTTIATTGANVTSFSSTGLTANTTYALTNNPWLTPTAIANPRLYKVSFTFDIR